MMRRWQKEGKIQGGECMTTIKEIAKRCNVSITTVSNVMNNRGKVSDETEKKIWEAAKELNYVPNYMAKNLKQKNNRNIGIIAEDLTVFHIPYVVDGINAFLDENNYTFILGNMRLYQKHGDKYYMCTDYEDIVREELRIMAAKQVAGIIYIEGHCHEINCVPEGSPIPMVSVYGFINTNNVPAVIYDDEQGACAAVEKLLQHEQTKIGIITGSAESYHTRKRQQGYHKALYKAGVLYDPEWMEEGDWSRRSGYKAAGRLVEKGVRSIFAMNDLMAGGVYDYAREHKLEMGKDIRVIGFDDREICQAYDPQLTSVALPLRELGKTSAQMLLQRIENREGGTEHVRKIECILKVRGSV